MNSWIIYTPLCELVRDMSLLQTDRFIHNILQLLQTVRMTVSFCFLRFSQRQHSAEVCGEVPRILTWELGGVIPELLISVLSLYTSQGMLSLDHWVNAIFWVFLFCKNLVILGNIPIIAKFFLIITKLSPPCTNWTKFNT
jgi:hypothetical protein